MQLPKKNPTVLGQEAIDLLVAIVEEGAPSAVSPEMTLQVYELVKHGYIRDHFKPTDRGAAFAVVYGNASFSKYLKRYPESERKWSVTLANIKPKLGKSQLDVWFYIVCEVYLELDYFNEYNYMKAPDTLEMTELQMLNMYSMEKGLERGQIPVDLLMSMYMPGAMVAMAKNVSREELLSQVRMFRQSLESESK